MPIVVACGLTILSLPQAISQGDDLAGLEAQYEAQQKTLDKELLQLQLDLHTRNASADEYLAATQSWYAMNAARLQQQAELAANLDLRNPLPADPGRVEPPKNPALAAKQRILEAEWAALRASAKDPEEAQVRIAEWEANPNNKRRLNELEEAGKDQPLPRPHVDYPEIAQLDVSDPIQAELRALLIRRRDRFNAIYDSLKKIDPREIQELIGQAEEAFPEETRRITELQKAMIPIRLRQQISQL